MYWKDVLLQRWSDLEKYGLAPIFYSHDWGWHQHRYFLVLQDDEISVLLPEEDDDFSIPLAKELGSGSFFIIDSNVYKLYFENNIFDKSAKNFLIIKASELNKSIDKCMEIIEILVEKKIRHNQRMVAIGGGIIQDITSFTASIYLRGIEWSFFPTTLLAQADSCIGGKTSINLGTLKNIVGNFNPPVKIYLDIDFLATLSKEDIKSGIGEILHFYYYSNSPYIKEIANTYDDLIINPKSLLKYINESLMIKKTVIETDEFDKSERNKFNYGHTFGHAIETSSNYVIKHGQAVTVGMDIANYISYYLGLIDLDEYNRNKSDQNFAKNEFRIQEEKFNILASDDGPLALAYPLIEKLLEKAQDEQQTKDYKNFENKLIDKNNKLINFIKYRYMLFFFISH